MNTPGPNFATKDPQAAGFLAGMAEAAAAATPHARHKNARRRLEEAVDTFLNTLPVWRCGQRDVGTLGGDDDRDASASKSRSRSRSHRKSRKEKDKGRRR